MGKTKPGKCGETKAIFDGTVASLEDGLCGLELKGVDDKEEAKGSVGIKQWNVGVEC